MNIEGTYTLPASPQQVWHWLMDQEVLQHAIPGLERMEKIDQATYTLTLNIEHVPLKGSYQGRLTISEQHYPYYYRLMIEGEGRQGSINGVGSIHLSAHEATTIIAYKGTLTIGKPGAMLPSSTMVKGAAKLLIQQFFSALAEQQHNTQPFVITEPFVRTIPIQQITKTIAVLPAIQPEKDPIGKGIYTKIVQLLKLNTPDLEQNERRRQRLRRASIISGLLFLVWLGTRLPGIKLRDLFGRKHIS